MTNGLSLLLIGSWLLSASLVDAFKTGVSASLARARELKAHKRRHRKHLSEYKESHESHMRKHGHYSEGKSAFDRAGDVCKRDFFMTLETCVQPLDDGTVHVITGDIPAMWIRDSSAQLWPYIKFAKSQAEGGEVGLHAIGQQSKGLNGVASNSTKIRDIIEGALKRQAKYISSDPYANAFNKEYKEYVDFGENRLNRGGYVSTGNFEIDSGAYYFRLLSGFVDAFPDRKKAILDHPHVLEAVKKMIAVYRLERNHFKRSKYKYPQSPPWELPGPGGRGTNVGYTGMVWGGFRPSDDPQQLGYLVPSNVFIASQLQPIENFARTHWKDKKLANHIADLKKTITEGVKKHGVHKKDGKEVYCYEVDGLGGCNLMDDANVPSLLSLPYIDPSVSSFDKQIYNNTRKFILSSQNPWYFKGSAGEGIGSPHTGRGMIWPMSLVMQAFTAENDAEKKKVMNTLLSLNLEKQGLTESFNSNNADYITRAWFGWPNALFSEYMMGQGMCKPAMSDLRQFPQTQQTPQAMMFKQGGAYYKHHPAIFPPKWEHGGA
eukprot:TRINITY_DN169_c8_g1_i1.p1 TRINITY_DN169_c8_g1~~TRINITY_DN169_c8_g1_i1.p1  ORF type:complete len:547 (+),score=102.99 TRINITY_DN169_c8_g1_i1:69-1709(+)